MREILFRGKTVDTEEWKESPYPYGDIICGVVRQDFRIETVGQYTDLKDKNGKKIFEGDIVISTSPNRLSNRGYVVKYDPLSGYWMCNPERFPVIVGNIHDNPELLGGDVK